METVLLVVIVVLLAGLALGAALVGQTVKALRQSVRDLDTRIVRLQKELDRQQAALDGLRARLAERPEDPFIGVLDAVQRVRNRGWLATVAFIGSRLIRSYWSGKANRKALPAPSSREKTR